MRIHQQLRKANFFIANSFLSHRNICCCCCWFLKFTAKVDRCMMLMMWSSHCEHLLIIVVLLVNFTFFPILKFNTFFLWLLPMCCCLKSKWKIETIFTYIIGNLRCANVSLCWLKKANGDEEKEEMCNRRSSDSKMASAIIHAIIAKQQLYFHFCPLLPNNNNNTICFKLLWMAGNFLDHT